ncbi:polyhomeotic-like protein 2 isoform X2 [Denticeps clupeoides]|nr:polyhomeotic-like protein 2 isoform X2 [Denticeps clupeoides]
MLQQQKPQFVVQAQPQSLLSSRSPAQLLHTTSVQPTLQIQPTTIQAVAVQPQPQCHVPLLPKLAEPVLQGTIFHSVPGSQVLNPSDPAPSVPQCSPPRAKFLQQAPNTAAPPVQVSPGTDEASPNAAGLPAPAQTSTTRQSSGCESSQIYQHAEGAGAADGRPNARPGVRAAPAMTSGSGNNAPTVTGSAPQNGESKPPQAVVKPHILTHVIEGFVIQEGAEPFPVERPSLLIENLKKQKLQSHSDSAKLAHGNFPSATDFEMEDLTQQALKKQEEPTLSCELCGKVDFAYNFKRSKRFCSTVCAKRYNVGCTKRMGLFPNRKTMLEKLKKQKSSNNGLQNSSSEAKKQMSSSTVQQVGGSVGSPMLSQPNQGESSQCSDMSSYEDPQSPLSAASSGAQRASAGRGSNGQDLPLLSQHFLPSDPAKWNVEDVYEFIGSLPGCQEIAEEFRSQEIDGQALLLLKEDHLMSTMNIKLGPALKIFARISLLKDS